MTDSQKRLIEEYLNDLASERDTSESWGERYVVEKVIYGVMDVLGILGFYVDEYEKGHFEVGKDK